MKNMFGYIREFVMRTMLKRDKSGVLVLLRNLQEFVVWTISSRNKIFIFLMILPLFSFAGELPRISEKQLSQFREESKEADPPWKYVLVHADGSEANTGSSHRPVYLLNINADPARNVISSPEIDELVKGEFDVEIQRESLLSSGKTDYLVLSMSRPAEYNPRYFRCAAGHGEDRAYLFAIADGKAKVVSRFFGGCATSYEVIQDGAERGYRVIEAGEIPRSVRYMLRGEAIVREPDYQKKEGAR
ncbi:hypothetical protein [uncultured Herbaspirillum sp.]|uniref:hypothetical protein n=1 Tax=uncultured Herbaspirillum sp. TaxID=160236 RepID=UPI00258EC853|nr:hypothetical protein [uncultured Herbaspirillum sp.]